MRTITSMTSGWLRAALPLAIAGLAACGGGGGGGGATGTTLFTQGVVQGLGSYCVDGVRFDDANTAETLDDGRVIRPGMLITLAGVDIQPGTASCVDADGRNFTVNQVGVATAVFYDDELEGTVDSVDLNNGSFQVLGVTIVVDDTPGSATRTVYSNFGAGATLASINPGDQVEISGLPGDGEIFATFVENKNGTGDTESEAKGFVSSFNTPPGRFTLHIGTATSTTTIPVDFSGINPPLAGIADGNFVEVEGNAVAGTIFATSVQLEDDPFSNRAGTEDNIEIPGVLTAVAPDVNGDGTPDSLVFRLVGRTFAIDASGAFFEGGSAADLVDGIAVKVKGDFNQAGDTFIATEVEFRNARVEMEAKVEAVGANSITVFGKVINAGGNLRLRDNTGGTLNALGDLAVGDFVEVRAQLNDDGSLTASRVEREERAGANADGEEYEIRGKVTAFDTTAAQNFVEIVGIRIDLGSLVDAPLANSDFEDANETKVTRANFFSQLTVGAIIEAEADDGDEWNVGLNTLTANKVQLEN